MTIRKTIIMAAAVLAAAFMLAPKLGAQAPGKPKLSQDCIKYLSYYQEDYKAKKMDEATVYWRKAYTACPANASQNLYVHGTILMTRLYKEAKDPKLKQSLIDTILTLQDARIAAYPQKRIEVLNNKGLYMVNYRGEDKRYLYDNLAPIISDLQGGSSNSLLTAYFKSAVALFRENKLPAEDVMNAYGLVSECFEKATYKTDEQRADAASAKAVVGTLMADCKLADCETLVKIMTPRYEADPDNSTLAGTIVRLMNTADDCAGTELYFKAVTTFHKGDPSHRSAYALFRMNAARGNVAGACTYLEEAINDPDSDAKADAQYLYELSLYCYKNKMRAKALECANKAIELDNGYAGKAYLVIGNLWASAPCEGELNGYARFWASVDYYQKAMAADPSIEDDARSAIGASARHYPEASDLFMFDLNAGDSYTVRCGGMAATTTARVKKH